MVQLFVSTTTNTNRFMFSYQSLSKVISSVPATPRSRRLMAQSASNSSGKKLIRIDISSDTVCPWCLVGKKNLDKALTLAKDQFDFEVRWHPFQLNPSAPKEGVVKMEHYKKKFGAGVDSFVSRLTEVFRSHGLEFSTAGLTGNTLDSHRLIWFAGNQSLDKQSALAEELLLGYCTQGKYIGDKEYLIEAASKVGVEGAAEFLEDPNNGVQEVKAEIQKYSSNVTGVPHYVINGKYETSGGQPPEVLVRAFQRAAQDSN